MSEEEEEDALGRCQSSPTMLGSSLESPDGNNHESHQDQRRWCSRVAQLVTGNKGSSAQEMALSRRGFSGMQEHTGRWGVLGRQAGRRLIIWVRCWKGDLLVLFCVRAVVWAAGHTGWDEAAGLSEGSRGSHHMLCHRAFLGLPALPMAMGRHLGKLQV